MSGVTVIQDDRLDAVLTDSTQTVLAYFWADWCGPCKLVSPSIEAIAAEYTDRLRVVKLAVDNNPQSVKAYSVEGVPAIRLFRGGQLLHSAEGALTKAKLLEMLDRHGFPPT
jgi:thioredoxin 1